MLIETSLFDELTKTETLEMAFKAVKRNRGSAGIDGVRVEDFANNLAEELGQLKKELESWTYKPQPVRGVEIPKPGKLGGTRQLGVPCVRDRVVQTAIKNLLEPTLEEEFSEHSYGFRPGRNQRQGVEAAQKIVRSGKAFVVDIDLSKFFDRVCHDRLLSRLSKVVVDKRILRLIGLTLRSGIMKDGLLKITSEGTTQGSPLSPLLSNYVLHEFDQELERRGLEFCRYADDANIFVRTEKAAERVMVNITKFIEGKLKLKVNRDKSRVARSRQVKYLGMTIDGRKCRAISKESMERANLKVKALTPRGTHLPIEKSIEKINQWYVGWSNYYGMTQYPQQLKGIEAHIRRRLRARFVGQAKKKRHLYRKLRKHGCSHKAAKIVYTNKGPWALSKSGALNRAFSNAWFTEQGFKEVSSERRKGWLSPKKTPWI